MFNYKKYQKKYREKHKKELGEYPNLICRHMNNEEIINQIKKWIKSNE